MPLDGEKLQAAYLERVRTTPPRPYPVSVAVWLGGLEPNSVAFLANRLFGLPPGSRWTCREDAEATILHWTDTETDSDRDRERHDLLARWMEAEQRRGVEVWPEGLGEAQSAQPTPPSGWPEPPVSGALRIDVVDGTPEDYA